MAFNSLNNSALVLVYIFCDFFLKTLQHSY